MRVREHELALKILPGYELPSREIGTSVLLSPPTTAVGPLALNAIHRQIHSSIVSIPHPQNDKIEDTILRN